MRMGRALVVLALACLAFGARAAPITVYSNLSTGHLYGGRTSGTFDLAAVLAAPVGDYTIGAASVAFRWTGNADDPTFPTNAPYTDTRFGPYSCSGISCTRTATRTTYYTDVQQPETVDLTIAGTAAGSAHSSPLGTSTRTYATGSDRQTDGSTYVCTYFLLICWSGYERTYYTDYYQYVSTTTYLNGGTFGLTYDLAANGGAPLSTLLGTGSLPFSFDFTSGDALLSSAVLTVDAVENPAPAPHGVPAPGSGTLTGSAVLALLLFETTRRK